LGFLARALISLVFGVPKSLPRSVERDDHGVGPSLFEQREQHGCEAVEGIRWSSVARTHVARRKERSVQERISINDHQAAVSHVRKVTRKRGLASQLAVNGI